MTIRKAYFSPSFHHKTKTAQNPGTRFSKYCCYKDEVSWEVGQFFSNSLYIKYYLYQSILKIFLDVEVKNNYPTAQMGMLIMVAGFQLGSCWVIG